MVRQLSWTAKDMTGIKFLKVAVRTGVLGSEQAPRPRLATMSWWSTVHTWLCATCLLCAPALHPCASRAPYVHLPRIIPAPHVHLPPTSVPTHASCAPAPLVCPPPPVCTGCPQPPCAPAPVPLAYHICGCRDGFQAEEQEGIGTAVLIPNTEERVRRC